ncbi:MAG: apolipoprotein N-acyltransferase [Rhodospirillales bacterium]
MTRTGVARIDRSVAGASGGRWLRLAHAVGALTGWRRAGLAVVLGGLAALALPPVGLVPLLAVSFTGLVWLCDGTRRRRAAFWAGWWFGLGFFVAGLYWIGVAFLVDVARFGWMIPFAVVGLSAYLAIFCGLATLGMRLIAPSGAARVLALAAAWTVAEWLRGVVLTGFPWNLIGSAWTVSDAMLQPAAAVGTYGLSLLTVLAAASPAASPGRATGRWVATAAVGLAMLWAGGTARLTGADGATAPGVVLRLVQPNIPQALKWRADVAEANFAKLLRLSGRPGETRATHVLWPETATPYFLANDPLHRAAVAAVVPPGGMVLSGSIRATPERTDPPQVWNSLVAVDDAGHVAATYDKFHLVPFGEYVPWRSVLPLDKITPGALDFSPGPGPRTLDLPRLPPVGPLICYEVIFPAAVTDPAQRPQWLLNVTNDAWYGRTSGPYQHFATARLRAVEEGLPVVRVANNGISGVIDAHGRVTARIGLAREGAVDARLPVALNAPTPYARFGDAIPGALAVLCALTAALLSRRRVRVPL